MSFSDIIGMHEIDLSQYKGMEGNITERAGFLDVAGAALRDTQANMQINSRALMQREVLEERRSLYEQITGEALPKFGKETTRGFQEDESLLEQYIKQLRVKDERFNSVYVGNEIAEKAIEKARQARIDLGEIGATTSGFTRIAGGLAGGLASMPTDPVALVTMPLGFASTGRTVLQVALREAALSAGIETIISPEIYKWQNEVGHKFGLGDILTNVATQALFAGSVSAAAVGIPRAYRNYKSVQLELLRTAPINDDGKIFAKGLADIEQIKENNLFRFDVVDRETKHMEHFDAVARSLLGDEDVVLEPIAVDDWVIKDLSKGAGLTGEVKNLTPDVHYLLNNPPKAPTPSLAEMVRNLGNTAPPKGFELEFSKLSLNKGILNTRKLLQSINPELVANVAESKDTLKRDKQRLKDLEKLQSADIEHIVKTGLQEIETPEGVSRLINRDFVVQKYPEVFSMMQDYEARYLPMQKQADAYRAKKLPEIEEQYPDVVAAKNVVETIQKELEEFKKFYRELGRKQRAKTYDRSKDIEKELTKATKQYEAVGKKQIIDAPEVELKRLNDGLNAVKSRFSKNRMRLLSDIASEEKRLKRNQAEIDKLIAKIEAGVSFDTVRQMALDQGFYRALPSEKRLLKDLAADAAGQKVMPRHNLNPELERDIQFYQAAMQVRQTHIDSIKQAGLKVRKDFAAMKKDIETLTPEYRAKRVKDPEVIEEEDLINDIETIRQQTPQERALATEERQVEIQKQFDTLLEENPNGTITIDDVAFSLKQLREDLDLEEQMVKALSVCAV